ncbi:MAG: hypothetical protein JO345_33065 [Streptosporangiaceae bacterium]|nr:hypothetical protein [Streptosporangiaceae bacterium]
MTVNDTHLFMLRAHLGGEDEAVRRTYARITDPIAMCGLAELVFQAFLIAARRKFSPTWNHAQVISFVARLRAALCERPELLDPITAELELCRALGEDVNASPDVGATATARLILLDALIESLNLDDEAIWDLLLQARKNALRHYGENA